MRNIARRALVVIGAACVVLARSSPCGAQTSATVSDASLPIVEVVVATENPGEGPAIDAIVRELLGRLHVAPVVTHTERIDPIAVVTPRPAVGAPVLARLWLDLRAGTRATLYVADGAWERILVRHVSRVPGAEEVSREALGRLLEAAVEALQSGAQIGLTRDEVRPTLTPSLAERDASPPPVPRPSDTQQSVASRWWRAQLGVHYEAQGFASEALVQHGPAVSLLAGLTHVAAHPSLWLSAQYRVPTIVDAVPIGVRLDTGAVRLLVAGEWSAGSIASLRIGLGGGFDVARIEPRRTVANGLQLEATSVAVYPMFRALIALHLQILPGIGLLAAIGCDVDPTASRYVVVQGTSVDPVLVPWPVRPVVSIGVTAP